MKAMGTLWMLVGFVAMASPALGSTRHVNCDVPGQTITKALKTAQPGDTIRVRGTCKETVTITTDRLTLHGMDNATIRRATPNWTPCRTPTHTRHLKGSFGGGARSSIGCPEATGHTLCFRREQCSVGHMRR